MKFNADRRGALVNFSAGLIVSGIAQGNPVNADVEATLAPANAKSLRQLSQMLVGIPRRRDFKTVPMILDDPSMWDAAALDAVLAYAAGPKQAWDNTDLLGPWLKGMRNSMNAQIWSFKEPNFLCVSATHGSAHLALFDQYMWDKYQLAKLAGRGDDRNTFILTPSAFPPDAPHYQSAEGALWWKDASLVVLQRRGVVFMACHNAIWELAETLVSNGENPEHLEIDSIAAELTNHLIPDVVLTPGTVAALVKLQRSGFAYSR